MLLSRPHWLVAPALGLLLCIPGYGRAQAPEPEDSPFSGRVEGSRFRDKRDRRLSESARRFGREHRGAIILGIEPILSHGRSLNRIKSLDADGRVLIWIDDPLQPHLPLRREDDDLGDDGDW